MRLVYRTLELLANLVLVPLSFLFLSFLAAVLFACRLLSRLFVPKLDVAGKTVVITGASSGIGEHLAYEYALHGARLLLVARRVEALRKVARKCGVLGADRSVEVLGCDVCGDEDCARIIRTAIAHFGGVDVLVLNAGITNRHFFESGASAGVARPVWETNVVAPFLLTLHALPWLKKSRGQIVAISSVVDFVPFTQQAVYNASKSAVRAFFETLRAEPAGTRVNISLVFPGLIATEMTAGRFLMPDGTMALDMEARDEQMGPIPMLKAKDCSHDIFRGATAKQPHIIVPLWYVNNLFYRLFAPEVLLWNFRAFYRPFGRRAPAPSKLLMQAIPVSRNAFYAEPAISEENVKTE